MEDTSPADLPHDLVEASGAADVRRWLEAQWGRYTDDVRWQAPRRGLALAGRAEVLAHLERELAVMTAPRLAQLRCCARGARAFHEYTIRFRLTAPGIAGVKLPAGAEVELERLCVLTLDAAGRVAAEDCIETWTRLGERA